MGRLPSRLRDDRGIILPFTLFIIMLLTTMTLVLLAIGASEPQIATNLLRGTQALTVAEAGLERAIGTFVADSSTVNNACSSTCPGSTTSLIASTSIGSIGSYVVTYKPIAYATVLIESTGTNAIGTATRKVRTVVTTQFTSDYAILADEVEVSGNGQVTGTKGAIHGNSEAEVSGSAWVAQTATTASTSSSNCSGCTTSSLVGNTSGSGASKPSVSIPTITPSDYQSKADVLLNDAGTITYGGTTYTSDSHGNFSGTFSGWKMNGTGEWQYSGSSTPPSGLYYATKEIKVSSNVGSSGSPWSATLVAGSSSQSGDVKITGNVYLSAYYKDVVLVSGEVEVEGHTTITGTILGKSEVELKGNVALTGSVVSNGEVEVSGSAVITYNTATRTTLTGALKVTSWSSVSY